MLPILAYYGRIRPRLSVMTSQRARFVAIAIIGLAIVGASITPVSAHAAYKSSDPADESTVPSAPSQIWAEFTEPPDNASRMQVFDPCGDQVDAGDSRSDGYRVYVSMSGSRAGTYRVTFFVNSAVDNHPTRGEFTFTVADGEECPGAEPREPRKRDGSQDRDSQQPSEPQNDPAAGDGDAPVSSNDQPDSDAGAADGDRNSGGPAGRGRQGQSSGDRPDNGSERDRAPDEGTLVAADPPEPEEPGLFTGIPIGGLVVALLMASIIGAGGGLIYAGIMGYRR